MKQILNLIKLHKIISGVIVLVLIFGGYEWYTKSHTTVGKTTYVMGAATKGTIVVSVTGSGQMNAQNKIDLKPGGSGQTATQLTSVKVKQGDQVKAGQVIATADEKNNNVALIQARASLASAQANYDKLLTGLTGTDLQSAQLSVTTAQQSLDKAHRDYNNTVVTQQQNVAKALSNFLNADLTATPSDANTTATITLSGQYNGSVQGQYNISIYQGGDGLYYQTSGLGGTSGVIKRGIAQALGNGLYITFGTSGTISASSTWTVSVPNLASTNYFSNNSAYQTALQNQTQALQQAQDTITSAQNSLTQAQLTLQSKTAAPARADVAQAQAQIDQAESQVASAEVNYDNNIIKSPFDGVVAAVNSQAGDQVTSSTVVATIITNQELAIISLNEVDASKVKVGQKTTLTFDAVDGLTLTGKVAQIDTIGTVSQGVVTYTAKISLDTQDGRIKPGMSVSVAIITDLATDVLTVPSSAVKSNANGSYVQELDSAGVPQNKSVQTGLSNATDTEITSGLAEGETIVTQTIKPTTAKTTTTTTNNASIIPGLGGAATGGGAARFRTGN